MNTTEVTGNKQKSLLRRKQLISANGTCMNNMEKVVRTAKNYTLK